MRIADTVQTYDGIRSAEYALDHLNRALDLLNNARGWGIADILVGGVLITLAKRKKMDQAKDELQKANTYIGRLVNNLEANYRQNYLDLETEGWTNVFDYFGLFVSDFYVQTKIKDAIRQIKETITKLEAIRDRLYELNDQED